MDIPSDPTTMDPNVFLMRMVNKKNCVDYLIKYMGDHPINTQTQTQTPSGTLCNGKYWNPCPTGTTFYCPPTGDAQCKQPTKSNDQVCQDSFGLNANWNGTKNNNGDLNCGCTQGFTWNSNNTACISVVCQNNSTLAGNQCVCNNGYVLNGNECITYTQNCQNKYGINSYGDGKNCYCNDGYQWNTSQTDCVIIPPAPVISTQPTKQTTTPPIINKQPVNNPPPVKNDTPVIIERKVETEPPAPIIATEQKVSPVFGVPSAEINSQPVKKISWWGKIWNWFMRK
jgi:hypothetical protein